MRDIRPRSRWRFAPRVMRQACPSCNREGAGKAGYLLIPMARVQKKMHAAVTTGVSRISRPSLRNGFNGFLRALLGDHAWLPPSSARRDSVFANLTPASERQDHTTSPSADALLV